MDSLLYGISLQKNHHSNLNSSRENHISLIELSTYKVNYIVNVTMLQHQNLMATEKITIPYYRFYRIDEYKDILICRVASLITLPCAGTTF